MPAKLKANKVPYENSQPTAGHNLDGRSVPCLGQFKCIYCGLNYLFQEMQDSLVGRVLTVIDGCVVSEAQNKAIKDISKNVIYDVLSNSRQAALWSVSNFVEQEYREAHMELVNSLPPGPPPSFASHP